MNSQLQNAPGPDADPLRVLLVDNDEDITALVNAILSDEGYAVATLNDTDHASVASAVGRVEPDCILLDSAEGPAFGGSWGEAAYLSRRDRPVPAVMFTAHSNAVAEARDRRRPGHDDALKDRRSRCVIPLVSCSHLLPIAADRPATHGRWPRRPAP